MNRLLISLIAFLFIFTACQAASKNDAPSDPAAVMDAYAAAINAHDVEKALSFVAEEAVYDRSAGNFNGKDEVRTFIEGIIARHVKVSVVGERQVDGERVSWHSRVMLDDPENPDGPQLEVNLNSESVVRNGLIVEHNARVIP